MLYPNLEKNQAYYPILDTVKVVGTLTNFMEELNDFGIVTDSMNAISTVHSFNGLENKYIELEETLENRYNETTDVYLIMFRCYERLKSYAVWKHDTDTINQIKQFADLCLVTENT